jgi:hypothetical protein
VARACRVVVPPTTSIYDVDIIYRETAMRVLVDVGADEVKALDDLAREERTSRAALIRTAVAAFLDERAARSRERAFGLWGNRRIDGLAYQERVRGGW